MTTQPSSRPSLQELAAVFGRIGILGFGGPAAHIAMMEEEVVRRRRWMGSQDFLDLVGATNLIPGPNSTEMAIHLGLRLRGWAGLLVAGSCFIIPACLITGILAWSYVRYGSLPEVSPFLAGIKPAVIAVILVAVLRFARKAVKSLQLALLAAAVMIAALLGGHEALLILAGGALGMVWQVGLSQLRGKNGFTLLLPVAPAGLTMAAAPASAATLTGLGLFFLKVGCILFGSGYVLFAYLEGGLVRDMGWLSSQQLIDAVAVGQFTPGPILSTSTFVGYLVLGWPGALVASGAIFLPSFLFVLALSPIVPLLRRNRWAAAFLDSVNVSTVALMAVVLLRLGEQVLLSTPSAGIALAATLLLYRFKLNSGLIIVAGAAAGWLMGLG